MDNPRVGKITDSYEWDFTLFCQTMLHVNGGQGAVVQESMGQQPLPPLNNVPFNKTTE